MEITKAVSRIFWRFGGNGNKKPFPVNEGDIQAYNVIKDYVAQTQKEQFENHELFAKMYIYTYMRILENDKTTVFDPNSRRKIYNLLKKPLTQIIEDFTKSLNDAEQYELLEGAGIHLEHPALTSEEKRSTDTRKLKEALKKPENVSRLKGEVWEFEFVKDCLEKEVNKAINQFN